VNPPTVAVVGAGFSGTLTAIHLLARGPDVRVLLIERRDRFARGLAYSTPSDRHLLNVRTGRMSAFPDRTDDLVRWLEANGHPADPKGFTPRKLYGEYLGARLTEAEQAAPGRLTRIAGEVTGLEVNGGVTLRLADGGVAQADAAVLALGNPPPDTLRPFTGLPPDRFIADPWARGALAVAGGNETVLLVGTGLTMIDVVLALEEHGWGGHALALSRRGLLPRSHPVQPPPEASPWRPDAGPMSKALHAFRRKAREASWDVTMDAIRPFNQALWRELPDTERRRFLRHLRPWWDVHRHRTAPEIGAHIQDLIRKGRLEIAAGRIEAARETDGAVEVAWRPRGGAELRTLRVDRIVNCTGPLSDLSRSPDALVKDLLARGLARVDPYRLGLDTDVEGRLIDAQGRPEPRLFAIGPPTRPALWEINAVPEVRGQAAAVADAVAASLKSA
jgi:uncharacterized NAD(P)/FAD-binding protein YdhS